MNYHSSSWTTIDDKTEALNLSRLGYGAHSGTGALCDSQCRWDWWYALFIYFCHPDILFTSQILIYNLLKFLYST